MKLLSKLTSVTLSVFLCIAFSIQCFASEGLYNGFWYTSVTDDTVSIINYTGDETEISIPNKTPDGYVTQIENFGLQNKTFTSLNLGTATHLQTLGSMAFNGCESISGELLIPPTITTMKMGAFQSCSSISSVNVMARVSTISEQCFNRCDALQKVSLPSTLKTIEKLAFANCPNLTLINIPISVSSIDSTAFQNSANVVIKCEPNSYAHRFAIDKGLNVSLIPHYGDANSDGKVNILDVTAIQRYKIGELDLSDYAVKCADVNKDGSVTIRDATLIQMKLAKYDVDF